MALFTLLPLPLLLLLQSFLFVPVDAAYDDDDTDDDAVYDADGGDLVSVAHAEENVCVDDGF